MQLFPNSIWSRNPIACRKTFTEPTEILTREATNLDHKYVTIIKKQMLKNKEMSQHII